MLRSVNLELTVLDYDRIGGSDPIGKVVLGYKRKKLEKKHWVEMVENPRRPIIHWHVLQVFFYDLLFWANYRNIKLDSLGYIVTSINVFSYFDRILSQTRMMKMKRRKKLKLKRQRMTRKLVLQTQRRKMTRKNRIMKIAEPIDGENIKWHKNYVVKCWENQQIVIHMYIIRNSIGHK